MYTCVFLEKSLHLHNYIYTGGIMVDLLQQGVGRGLSNHSMVGNTLNSKNVVQHSKKITYLYVTTVPSAGRGWEGVSRPKYSPIIAHPKSGAFLQLEWEGTLETKHQPPCIPSQGRLVAGVGWNLRIKMLNPMLPMSNL